MWRFIFYTGTNNLRVYRCYIEWEDAAISTSGFATTRLVFIWYC